MGIDAIAPGLRTAGGKLGESPGKHLPPTAKLNSRGGGEDEKNHVSVCSHWR